MKLQIIDSGSHGNAYLLKAETTRESLLIECGVKIQQIKKALGFNLRDVSCIVSHSHNDHSSAMEDLLKAGVNVYAGKETHQAKGTDKHHRAYNIFPGFTYVIGGFKIKPFAVNHDVPTLGFLINHVESGLVLFLTDTFFTDYKFPGLNNIIIECNHDLQIVAANERPRFLQERVAFSHMNLDTCRTMLQANDLTQVNNVVLIHLSDSGSNAAGFKKDIAAATGKPVTVAEPGLIIQFDKTPF